MAPKKKSAAEGKAEAKAAPAPAEKRKAEEKEAEAPAKKEAKTEAKKETKIEAKPKATPAQAKAEPKKEEVKKEEQEDANAEKEQDAPADKRAALKDAIGFNTEDTTLNVVPTFGDKVLTTLSEGGMQYLIAGARANVGVKAGRHLYEVRVLQSLDPAEAKGAGRGRLAPRQVVRVGFSTSSSPLVMAGDQDDFVYFDADGLFVSGKHRTNGASQRFGRDQVIGVLLNLDPKGPNTNTVSLFRDGVRISKPVALPESLQGKTLFPHINFRYATVQVNFGADPLSPLPFKTKTFQLAAQADTEAAKQAPTKSGKYEVLFPVGMPDEGTFEWLDNFLAKNPHFVEISDRKIIQWAEQSGLWRGKSVNWKNSNDKPDFNFGIPAMDDSSARRVATAAASVVPRNYVIMEVKSNLVEAERAELLKRFTAQHYYKVAHVVMGEPSQDHKDSVQEKLLKDKQDKLDAAFKQKKQELDRKKALADMRRRSEEAAKKVAADRKAAAEKKAAEEKAKKAAEEGKMEVDEGAKKEETQEEKKEEEEQAEPPQAELTEEEKKVWFTPNKGSPDIAPTVLNQSFGSFSIPEATEGFDKVQFEWQKDKKAKEYLRTWILERKRNSRIEDLQPGQYFVDKLKDWQKAFGEFQAKQKAHQAKGSAGGEKKEEDEAMKIEVDDILSVKDVSDVGNGEPLYKDFQFEDWALLQLRYELYLLIRGFATDVNDPDRVCQEQHFPFYYNRYFRKNLTPQAFGMSSFGDLLNLVKDLVEMDSNKIISLHSDEELETLDSFVKQVEEVRRARQRRIDAGDETSKLKFTAQALQQTTAIPKGAGGGAGPQRPVRAPGPAGWGGGVKRGW